MNKQTLIISCPASSRSGYGDHSRDIIRSLIAMNRFDVKIMDQRWGSCSRNALTDDDIEITSRIMRKNFDEQPDIWVQITVPNEFQKVGKYNIGITAGIETTSASSQWVEGCNNMDLIIVPSEHAKTSLKNSTFDIRDSKTNETVRSLSVNPEIVVLFEGLDLSTFIKTDDIPEIVSTDISTIPEEFCYLFVGHWLAGDFSHDRKDVGGMIRTFLETFKGIAQRNQPALILKTSSATFSLTDRESILEKISKIYKSVDGAILPKIYLIHGDMTQQELNGLYNHNKVKAMISFTHGEGFGRPLLEFGITGKPIMYPNWSGHVDFLSEHCIPLTGTLRNVHKSAVWKDVILPESKWFYVDYNHASGIIRDVHKQYKKHMQRSRKQTQYIKDNFSIKKMNSDFNKIIGQYVPQIGSN